MKKIHRRSTTYKVAKVNECVFYVDIVYKYDEEELEAWLYEEMYGLKHLMFSVDGRDYWYEDFVDMVDGGIEDYVEFYIKEYMHYEDDRLFETEEDYLDGVYEITKIDN